MERDGCPSDCCSYNVIVRGFLQNNGASRAEQLFQEMFDRGFSADALTRTLAADLLSKDDNLGLKRLLGESECCQGEKVM
jgi:pentatricopeptide repeat protein